MKAYWEGELGLHIIQPVRWVHVSDKLQATAALTLEKQYSPTSGQEAGWKPRVGPDAFDKRNISGSLRSSNLASCVIRRLRSYCTYWATPVPLPFYFYNQTFYGFHICPYLLYSQPISPFIVRLLDILWRIQINNILFIKISAVSCFKGEEAM
jgi:hypothetical protein